MTIQDHAVLSHTIWSMQDAAYATHFMHLSSGEFIVGYHDGVIKIKSFAAEKVFPATHSQLLSILALQNEKVLISSHEDGKLYFWNRATRQLISKLATGRVCSILELPDGILAMGMKNSNIVLLDLETQETVAQFGTPSLHVGDILMLLPTGELMSGRRDTGALFVWDIEHKRREKCFRTHADIYALTLLPDGQHIATSHRNGNIYVWNIAEERCVAELSDNRLLIHSLVALSNDYLAAGDAEGNIKVWDIKTQQCVTVIPVKKTRSSLICPTYVNLLTLLPDDCLAYVTNYEAGVIDLAYVRQRDVSAHAQPHTHLAFSMGM